MPHPSTAIARPRTPVSDRGTGRHRKPVVLPPALAIVIRAVVLLASVLLAATIYGAAILIRGVGPNPADLRVAFSLGPVVLLLASALGTAQWHYLQSRAYPVGRDDGRHQPLTNQA